ncbi:hypothetical protein ACSQ6I_02115 [Anabaena sp. WFMT]|uniref:hypothetical protein n=1 Tax=Anabaena sp. WFMT TaxID=3449730 RepID=UPI003F22A6BB
MWSSLLPEMLVIMGAALLTCKCGVGEGGGVFAVVVGGGVYEPADSVGLASWWMRIVPLLGRPWGS